MHHSPTNAMFPGVFVCPFLWWPRQNGCWGESPDCHPEEFECCNDGSQVFSPAAAAIFIATGAGLFYYFKSEKESLKKKKGCVVKHHFG